MTQRNRGSGRLRTLRITRVADHGGYQGSFEDSESFAERRQARPGPEESERSWTSDSLRRLHGELEWNHIVAPERHRSSYAGSDSSDLNTRTAALMKSFKDADSNAQVSGRTQRMQMHVDTARVQAVSTEGFPAAELNKKMKLLMQQSLLSGRGFAGDPQSVRGRGMQMHFDPAVSDTSSTGAQTSSTEGLPVAELNKKMMQALLRSKGADPQIHFNTAMSQISSNECLSADGLKTVRDMVVASPRGTFDKCVAEAIMTSTKDDFYDLDDFSTKDDSSDQRGLGEASGLSDYDLDDHPTEAFWTSTKQRFPLNRFGGSHGPPSMEPSSEVPDEAGMSPYYDYLNGVLEHQMRFKVYIWMYDISGGAAKEWFWLLLGESFEGIWHTGVVVEWPLCQKEFWFGGRLFKSDPGKTPFGQPVEKRFLGYTHKFHDEVMCHLSRNLASEFTQENYDVLTHNCNHFSDRMCMYLMNKHLPDDILKQPDKVMNTLTARALRPLFNRWLGGFGGKHDDDDENLASI